MNNYLWNGPSQKREGYLLSGFCRGKGGGHNAVRGIFAVTPVYLFPEICMYNMNIYIQKIKNCQFKDPPEFEVFYFPVFEYMSLFSTKVQSTL